MAYKIYCTLPVSFLSHFINFISFYRSNLTNYFWEKKFVYFRKYVLQLAPCFIMTLYSHLVNFSEILSPEIIGHSNHKLTHNYSMIKKRLPGSPFPSVISYPEFKFRKNVWIRNAGNYSPGNPLLTWRYLIFKKWTLLYVFIVIQRWTGHSWMSREIG